MWAPGEAAAGGDLCRGALRRGAGRGPGRAPCVCVGKARGPGGRGRGGSLPAAVVCAAAAARPRERVVGGLGVMAVLRRESSGRSASGRASRQRPGARGGDVGGWGREENAGRAGRAGERAARRNGRRKMAAGAFRAPSPPDGRVSTALCCPRGHAPRPVAAAREEAGESPVHARRRGLRVPAPLHSCRPFQITGQPGSWAASGEQWLGNLVSFFYFIIFLKICFIDSQRKQRRKTCWWAVS